METLVANLAGKTRRERWLGRDYLVAPLTLIVPGVPNSPGVYGILNTVTGKWYVGSSATSLRDRLTQHRKGLRAGCHCNRHLQSSYCKYGECAFQVAIFKICAPDRCLEFEQFWLDYLRSADARFGYNICSVAGSCRGVRPSARCIEVTRARCSGKKRDPESVARGAASNRGRKRSPEAVARMKAAQNRPEVKAKVKAGLAKPEVRERLRLAQLGKKHTLESRLKMSAQRKGKKLSPEACASMSAAAKLRWATNPLTETARQKIADTLRRRAWK